MQLPKKALRRNSVVVQKNGGFYGRVIRVLPDGRIFWLCGGLHFHISRPESLEVKDFKGDWYRGFTGKMYYKKMSSLRSLKIKAKRYHYEFAHNTPLDYKHIAVEN